MAWAIVPVIIAIQFSFNAGRSRTAWQGFSLSRWYWGDPINSVWQDPGLQHSLVQSLKLAGLDVLIAVPIGVALALGLARWRGRGSGAANFLMLFPLITPEIVMGVALFVVFLHLFTVIQPGTTAQVLGHVTFSISYVVVVIRGRLFSIGRDYEEAAMDLGATPWTALRLVLLPLLLPAVLASAVIVFAISIDDFVISAWLSCGQGCSTVPIQVYSSSRAAPLPSINALAATMVYATVLVALVGYGAYRVLLRGQRGSIADLGA
jgi:spermidine/putrescine transport system permease protein